VRKARIFTFSVRTGGKNPPTQSTDISVGFERLLASKKHPRSMMLSTT
jgi:hypothetical protein